MTWPELCRLASAVVEQTRAKLPPPLREAAARLPVTLEPFPSAEMLDGTDFEPDILGLFVGPDHGHAPGASVDVPAQVILFLENLWDEADGDPAAFREQVRITYLHELGHFFGWDEDEVARRGLA